MALNVTSAPWQQIPIPAIDLRRQLGFGRTEGVAAAADLAVAQRAAGANMSVDIAAGEAFVQGDSVTNQGRYYAYNDAVFNLTGFTAAHATLPRIDRVTLRVRDAFHGDAANDVSFQIVTGTATSGATLSNLNGAASVPASQLLLANILIPAASTSITTANIDTTVRGLALFGGQVALTSLQQGGATVGQTLRWTGSAWAPATPNDRGTSLPGSPVNMQEYTLVDSLTAPTYQWHLRYSTDSSQTDKWEFLGGTPLKAQAGNMTGTPGTAYVDTPTPVSITVPRSGVYRVEFFGQAVGAAGNGALIAPKRGSNATADADSQKYGYITNDNNATAGVQRLDWTLAASDVVKAQYRTIAGAVATQNVTASISILPVRLS